MLKLEVLIWELGAINYHSLAHTLIQSCPQCIHTRLPTGTIALGEVTTLDHESLNDTVERRPLISKVLLPGSQRSEVLNGLGHSLAVKTDHDAAHGLVAMADVEVNLVGDLGALDGLRCLGEEGEGDGDDQ